ncbi:MAG TPA: pyrroline-5-carboxylate reductase [Pyrinomonadaceae bacterium]|nr:pyrroline-5-carboxylate reductase [Pyrinomonadaceae bacterium]
MSETPSRTAALAPDAPHDAAHDAAPDAAANPLRSTHLSFVGAGAMAEAMIAGLLRRGLVGPEQITGSHPRAARRRELQTRYGIAVTESNREAAAAALSAPGDGRGEGASPPAGGGASAGGVSRSVVVLAVKPQRLGGVLRELRGALAPEQLALSIVAGARMETISGELLHPAVVRAMPNTPAQVGEGMTAWTPSPPVTQEQEAEVRAVLGALGREMRVENENMIDMATALSATGPTYIFMMMEALVDAGVHMGFSRHVAQELVTQTMLGSVLFARESGKHPAELRNMVTSPGGTSAEAIYQMEKGSLRTVLSKAVYAAYQRAVALGRK